MPKKQTKDSPSPAIDALGRIRGLETEIAAVLRQMGEKVEQLEALNQFSALLNSSLDTSVVREKALEATCKLLRCETASLFLVDAKRAELYWETALGEAGKELQRSVRLPIDDRSIAGYVAMHGEALIVNDVAADPRHFRRQVPESPQATGAAARFTARTMVCVPLTSKGKIVGVLQALNKLPSVPERVSRHAWPVFFDEDRRMLETLAHQVAIAVENAKLYSSIKRNFFDTCEALAEAIEKKDRYTGGHTKRVVYYSMCIAKYLDLNADELETLRMGAVLHDIGKIGIEDKVLKKEAPLEKDEWTHMQTHPEIGHDIMSRVEGLRDIMGGMRFHHERWDGKGYPLQLKGEEIPFIARVISIADAYDAMVSTRPYRKGLAPTFAYSEIVKNRGTQFDPAIVDAFVEAFRHEKMGKGSGGSSLEINHEGGPLAHNLANCD